MYVSLSLFNVSCHVCDEGGKELKRTYEVNLPCEKLTFT